MKGALCLCLVCLVSMGCAPKRPAAYEKADGNLFVSEAPERDPELEQARVKAQESLEIFIERLGRKKTSEEFSIKAPFPTSHGTIEHIWIEDLSFKNGAFSGKIANDPVDLPDLKLGSPVTVKKEDVEDWMIFDGEFFEGGFSADVFAKREGGPTLPRRGQANP